MQIRPDNANLLYANDAVYDWPSGDTQGQVQRGRDTTFATSPIFKSPETNATTGDVKVTAVLEVNVPVSATNNGNLPVAACNQTKTCPVTEDVPNWLDKSKLLAFGIGAGWSRDSLGNINKNSVTLSVPITPDYDSTGTIAAYSAKLYYETGATAWTNSHNVRLMWLVSVITDKCPDDNPRL